MNLKVCVCVCERERERVSVGECGWVGWGGACKVCVRVRGSDKVCLKKSVCNMLLFGK